MGDGITEQDLIASCRTGSVVRLAAVVEHTDGYLHPFVRLVGKAAWQPLVLSYRDGPKRWRDYWFLSRIFRVECGYTGPCCILLPGDRRLQRMGIVV